MCRGCRDLRSGKQQDLRVPIQLIVSVLITNSVEAHYGFPRMVRAQNADLLLFYRVGTTHAYDDAAIAMRRSSDNGMSWSGEEILWRCEAGFSAHNPVAIVASNGKVILWAHALSTGRSSVTPTGGRSQMTMGRPGLPGPYSIHHHSTTATM